MKFRVNEGSGECFYYLGVSDDGTVAGIDEVSYIESFENLKKIAHAIDCIVLVLEEKVIKTTRRAGYFMIREAEQTGCYVSLSIGVVGNVDAGKSTTVGTLTKGITDDGRGRARLAVFNHKHEISTGRTSSVGHQILGFDANGDVVNNRNDRTPSWVEIVNASTKVVSFYDMAGHEKYLKTTINGLTTIAPDYCLVLVGANMGPNHMTREHIYLCLTLKIPFVILVSKIDMVPPNVLEETMTKLHDIIKKGARRTPFSIKSIDDVLICAKTIKSESIVPILQFSNVTSQNLDLLKMLMNVLPTRNDYLSHVHEPVELLIDNSYTVTGHPTIVAGMLRRGIVNVGDTVCLGPFFDSSYKSVKIKSIHNKFRDCQSAKAGQYICLSLKGITRQEVKRGMVLVADKPEVKLAVKEFWCFINILHSPTTIRVGYQPFVHVDQARQSVRIMEIIKQTGPSAGIDTKATTSNSSGASIGSGSLTTTSTPSGSTASGGAPAPIKEEDPVLRTGDKAHIRCRFLVRPEYIKPQMKLIFREGRVKAAGRVLAKGLE
jgi:GTPase